MWYTRSMKYAGKLSIWISHAPLAIVEAVEESMGPADIHEIHDKEEKEHIENRY
jgi:hypothetical protein